MQITIKITEGKTLADVALEIQQLNQAMAPLLVNGPIPANPESETVEGHIGDCNTPPNEFGYVTIAINAYRKLIIPPGLSTSTFSLVIGDPVEEVDGSEIRAGALI